MKAKVLLLVLFVAALAGTGGWFAARHAQPHAAAAKASGRKILFYQSSMHPWIKSDKPGKCTICGMDLVPVFEGDKGFDVAEGVVALSSNSIQVVNVQTAEVRRRPLERALHVAGMLDDNDSRHRILSAYVDGRIDKLFVNYVGAEVQQGQPLATLYSPMLLTSQREYISLVRQTASATSPDVKSVNQSLLVAAGQRLKQFGLSEKQIASLGDKPELDIHSEILAPMSGTVVVRNVYEGQYVKEGEKLFEIADFSTMWFVFDAYERDLTWIKVGQKVEVTTPAAPGKIFTGAIAFIDPNIKDMTRSAKVRVEIPNPLIEANGQKRRELLHKLYAQGVVKIEVPEVLAVPRSAVLSPGAQPIVYVDKQGGSFEQRRVKLGRVGDDFWEVLDGLSAGERIVTTGNLLIDAQAQLNQSARQGESPATPVNRDAGTNITSLTDVQQKAARTFLTLADAVAKALSEDNLKEFNTQAATIHVAVPDLLKAYDDAKAWHPVLQKIEASGHFEPATNLKAARKEFFPFSQAVAEFGKELRAQIPDFRSVKIYQCPMVNKAFDGAPKSGLWLQTQAPIRNPFFGAEMLDCGTEVKP